MSVKLREELSTLFKDFQLCYKTYDIKQLWTEILNWC